MVQSKIILSSLEKVAIETKKKTVSMNLLSNILTQDTLSYGIIKALYHKLSQRTQDSSLNYSEKSYILNTCNNNEYKIDNALTEKGYNFLFSLYKTSFGSLRKNNPFNEEQGYILDNFKCFYFVGFEKFNNAYHEWFLPIWKVESKDNKTFSYVMKEHVQSKQIIIIE